MRAIFLKRGNLQVSECIFLPFQTSLSFLFSVCHSENLARHWSLMCCGGKKTTCTWFRGGLATEAQDLVSLLVSPFCVTHPPAAPSAQPLTEQLGFGQAKDTDGRCWGAWWPKGLPPPRRPPTSNYIVAPRPSHRLPHGQWQQHWDWTL